MTACENSCQTVNGYVSFVKKYVINIQKKKKKMSKCRDRHPWELLHNRGVNTRNGFSSINNSQFLYFNSATFATLCRYN